MPGDTGAGTYFGGIRVGNGTTVTTGADGTFFLQTNTSLDDGMDPYELRVSAPAFDPFVENRSWGTRPR